MLAEFDIVSVLFVGFYARSSVQDLARGEQRRQKKKCRRVMAKRARGRHLCIVFRSADGGVKEPGNKDDNWGDVLPAASKPAAALFAHTDLKRLPVLSLTLE